MNEFRRNSVRVIRIGHMSHDQRKILRLEIDKMCIPVTHRPQGAPPDHVDIAGTLLGFTVHSNGWITAALDCDVDPTGMVLGATLDQVDSANAGDVLLVSLARLTGAQLGEGPGVWDGMVIGR